jgi:hypothetical protein
MSVRTRLLRHPQAALAFLALGLLLAAGCDQPRRTAGAKGSAQKQNPSQPVVQPREILNKRTMNILNANEELAKGAQVGTTKITAKDPLTLPGNAYVTQTGRLGILDVQHALDLYHATNDRYPNYQEFMAEIIRANNIALPQLPYYQEYGYDEKEHKLIILEFPERKAQVEKQGYQ